MLRVLTFVGCLAAMAPASATAEGLTVLPKEGGVGLGRKLKMLAGGLQGKCTLEWKSENPEVATVDDRGVVSGEGLGIAKIRAQSRGDCQREVFESTIRVGAPVAAVRIAESFSVLDHCIVAVEATPVDASGTTLTDRPVRWDGERPGMAATAFVAGPVVDDRTFLGRTRVLRGLRVGRSSVSATSEGVTAVTLVRVLPDQPYSAQVLPQALEVDVQEKRKAMLVERNAGGCVLGDTRATWKLRNQSASPAIRFSTAEPLGDYATVEVVGVQSGREVLIATTERGSQAQVQVEVPFVHSVFVAPPDVYVYRRAPTILALPLSASGRGLTHRLIRWRVGVCTFLGQPVDDHHFVDPPTGYWTVVSNGPGMSLCAETTVTASCEFVDSQPVIVRSFAVATGTQAGTGD